MSRVKILVSDKLSRDGLQVLEDAEDVDVVVRTDLDEDGLCEAIADVDGLVIRSATQVTAKVLAAATQLRAIGRAGIGVDNVDLSAASKAGVVVMNTPFGNAVTTAEHALSLLAALARNIPQATASMKAGKWEKSLYQGRERWNKTLGIVGLGNIGKIVADRANGARMKVIAHDPLADADEAQAMNVALVSFADLLEQSDFITIHAPLVPSTRHLFDAEAFSKMKKSAMLVNAARGGIVDEGALVDALRSGEIAGAALDVFETEPIDPSHPLLGLDNIVLTPHLGASTVEAQNRVGVEIAEQMVEFLRTSRVRNGVNVPAISDSARARLGTEIEVAERLGSLVAQLCERPSELRVTASGAIADLVKPLTRYVVAAFMERLTGQSVNPLSAMFEAQERNISIVEATDAGDDRPNLRVTVQSEDGLHTATGRRSRSGELRLVGLEGYSTDAILEGPALIVRNGDEPGVIGAVGSVLGAHGINVSRLQVGLDEKTGRALALWNFSGEVGTSVLDELRALPHIVSVRVVDI